MKLVSGQGSEKSGACWMTALHFYTRPESERSWTDSAPWACVSPIIAQLCIYLNDRCADGEREALIGPHLFAPLGTNTGRADDITRGFLCADAAVRVFAPIAMRARGRADLARRLERCSPIVDVATALAGRDVAREVQAYAAAAAAAAAADAAAYAADAAADAANAAYAAYAADAAADAAAYAANAAYAAAYAAADDAADAADAANAANAARRLINRERLALILRCCEVGQRKEVTEACSRERVLEMLECGSVAALSRERECDE